MNQDPENNEIQEDEFSKNEAELTKRANERLDELAKSRTISYIDDDGYIVDRSPDGTIVRVSATPVR